MFTIRKRSSIRARFLAKLGEYEEVLNCLFKNSQPNLTTEYQKMMDTWEDIVNDSFDAIIPKKNRRPGINITVRELMREEK